MAVDRHRSQVLGWHMVKFCPPSLCTGNRAVAVADYQLDCGHTLRLRHYGAMAYRVSRGRSVIPPGGWSCMVCARIAADEHAARAAAEARARCTCP